MVQPDDYHIEAIAPNITITLEDPTPYQGRPLYIDNNSTGNITITTGEDSVVLETEGGLSLLTEGGIPLVASGSLGDVIVFPGQTYFYVSNGNIWREKLRGAARNITNITFADSPYLVSPLDEDILVDTTAGNVIIQLLSLGSASQRRLRVKKEDGSANIVRIIADPPNLIDGLPEEDISAQDVAIELRPGPNQWSRF